MNKAITNFSEVKIDHIDDNGVAHIDAYKSEDPNAEGMVLGYIINKEVYWTNPDYQFDTLVKSVVKDFQEA